jgi:protein O-mannosyl-transferase
VVTILLYAHTLHVPFYLDDNGALVDNYLLRDLPAVLRNLFNSRSLTNLTFALNYRLTGWALPPLHVVNIGLHAGCGLLVWLLLRRLFSHKRWLPLLGVLLFIAHPLQTEAVTYLVQRTTVLAAFLFLLAFFYYLRARSALAAGNARTSVAYLSPYIGAVLVGSGAALAKENAVTLPLVLVAYGLLFPIPGQRSWRLLLGDYLPFFVVPLALACKVLLLPLLRGEPLVFYNDAINTLQGNDSLHYFVTQFKVMWVYFRLLLFPYHQALLHNYPITRELWTGLNLLGLSGLLALAFLAWQLRRSRPLVAFGCVWFFLALAVESSLIPLDPLFEHRLYLPIFGFLLAALDGLLTMVGEKKTCLLGVVALLAFLPLTWQRNALWNDPVAFYQDNCRVTPDNAWAANNLGYALKEKGRLNEAIEQYERSLRLNKNDAKTYNNLGVALDEQGLPDAAISQYRQALMLNPNDAETHNNLGAALVANGQFNDALRELKLALEIKPDYLMAHNNLGVAFLRTGQLDAAIREYRKALAIDPGNSDVQSNLDAAIARRGRVGD